jgi:hypothetical protein
VRQLALNRMMPDLNFSHSTSHYRDRQTATKNDHEEGSLLTVGSGAVREMSHHVH